MLNLNPSSNAHHIQLKSQLIIHMDQEQQAQRNQHITQHQPQKQTIDPKYDKASTQFEKNYPKNIFIPIIEFLADMGLKEHYQNAVGTREEFQGKNVVSLSLIYQLLTEQWFLRSVNKGVLEANISNKILMNSKIKKKLFHLKVARILLHFKASDAKQYKKSVSRQANTIALQIQENDQLFQHPSSIIYLLNFLLDCLRDSFKDSMRNRQQFHEQQGSNQSHNRQFNSKEQFKNLTKTIITVLNKVQIDIESLDYTEQTVKLKISERAAEINKKYELAQNVPSWDFFNSIVISKCFKFKRDAIKITNSTFNHWILDFKQKTSQLGLEHLQLTSPPGQLKFFTPIVIIPPPE